MSKIRWQTILGLGALLAVASGAWAQQRPYIGFVYPAGGQQGQTFQVTLGGQFMDGVDSAVVSGEGVKVKIVEYNRHLSPQDIMLLREQLDELKKGGTKDAETKQLIAKLEKRIADYVLRPQSVAISNMVVAEVTISSEAKPSERELRLGTPRGYSNPMVFYVGQLPEVSAEPMSTSELQVLGKEADSLRKRRRTLAARGNTGTSEMMAGGSESRGGISETEVRIQVPSTVNGQIGSGEINRYRFSARKGQRLIITALGRQLIPYIADAVPGWFQPVLVVYDASGKEVAYDDDFRFKPDPVVFFDVPKDGEYAFAIYDGIYRGREDFVYRVTIGELPFVKSIFPLGGRIDTTLTVEMKGWNLPSTRLTPNTKDVEPGIYPIGVRKEGFYSNRVLLALDSLPDCLEREPNNTPATAQKVAMPIIINGRVDVPGDWDVFQFEGRAGQTIVAEVSARRLDSPLDSVLKITDAAGKQLAYNDDDNSDTIGKLKDVDWGVNTHHADSYIRTTLPANGTYYVHLGSADRAGGEEYAYRLRISEPQPDFALRVAPSSAGFRSSGGSSSVSVFAIRKDGFEGDITLGLKDAPKGFSSYGATIVSTQRMAQLSLSTSLDSTEEPVSLSIEGRATINGRQVAREAEPCEDRMQAFLWTHLVPAKEFVASVNGNPDAATPRRSGKKGKKK
ncbi:MAG: PPC domain-containing protein [Verrucomicrobia bacterium]|nr:PPC domain-containing protein [Verrucomicrobiota bacterium]